jgi:hypothetical protein
MFYRALNHRFYHMADSATDGMTGCGKDVFHCAPGTRCLPHGAEICEDCISAMQYCPLCQKIIRQQLDHDAACPHSP